MGNIGPVEIDSDTQDEMETEDLKKAVQHLIDGGVVAMPTDTLYGLAADVFNTDALERVYEIKQRDAIPLPVLVSTWEQVKDLAIDIPPQAEELAAKFWPGALTLVVYKAQRVPDQLTAGAATVAVRMPDHPVPIALINGLGGPITGTSANTSGGSDLKTLSEVVEQMGNRADYILKCGPEPKGTASTIVDITADTPKLLREGAIPFERIQQAWENAKNR